MHENRCYVKFGCFPTAPNPPLHWGAMRKSPVLAAVALGLGLALIAVAVVYWIEPAHSLPSFFPGHENGSNHHHVKHGIAAFFLGLALLAFAWFQTGDKQRSGKRPSAA
jgi:hypothetical protein